MALSVMDENVCIELMAHRAHLQALSIVNQCIGHTERL